MTPNIVKGSNSLPADRSDDPNHPRNNPAYQPDSLKDNSDSSSSNMSANKVDGDHAAKTMDAGANAATGSTELASGIHEDSQQTVSNVIDSVRPSNDHVRLVQEQRRQAKEHLFSARMGPSVVNLQRTETLVPSERRWEVLLPQMV